MSPSIKKEQDWPGYYSCDDLVPPLCDDELTVTTGFVETLPGLSIAYWRYTPKTTTKKLSPAIIAINGGPGLAHNYLKPLRALACGTQSGPREIIFYDQAGTGASRITNTPSSDDANSDEPIVYPQEIYDIQYYAETELPALIEKLKLKKFHLLGSSWGSQVAFQYAVSHIGVTKPALQSLILNGPVADNHLFVQYQWDLKEGSVGKLPLYVQKRFLQTKDNYDSPEYQNIYNNLQTINNARLGTLIDCWLETANAGFFNGQDLEQLAGPSDFFDDFQSTLGNWTVLPILHAMKKSDRQRFPPVMMNYGEFDFVHPRLVADTAKALHYHNVECHRVPRAGHSSSLDSPEFIYPKMHDFLSRVDDPQKSFRVDPKGICPRYEENDQIVTILDGPTTLAEMDTLSLQSLPPEYGNGAGAWSALTQFLLLVALLFVSFMTGAWYGEKKTRNEYLEKGYEIVGESYVR